MSAWIWEALLFLTGLGTAVAGLVYIYRQTVQTGIDKQKLKRAESNAEFQKQAAEVLAEHRTPDDTVNRMRDGSF